MMWFRRSADSKQMSKKRSAKSKPGLPSRFQIELLEDRFVPAAGPTAITAPAFFPTTTTPTITWNAATNATRYQLQVTDVTIGATVLNRTDLTGTSFVMPNLELGHRFRAWVRGFDGGNDPGLWSGNRDFMGNAAPGTTTITGPSFFADDQPTITWSAAANAHHYQIQITDRTDAQTVVMTDVHGTSFTPATELDFGHRHSVWVRAINANGQTGPWSGNRDFVALDTPVITGPGALGSISLTPRLEWNDIEGATRYEVELINDTTRILSLRNTDVVNDHLTLPPLVEGQQYAARVRMFDASGNAGPWSEVHEFGASDASAVLFWIDAMLDANAVDHGLSSPDQGGPTNTTRTFAMVSTAIFDAVNSITHNYQPYLTEATGFDAADIDAAIGSAAYHVLVDLHPQQQATLDALYAGWLAAIPDSAAEAMGVALGQMIANGCLDDRADDNSTVPSDYMTTNEPGHHQPDPTNLPQGFHGTEYGNVTPFVLNDIDDMSTPAPPALTSQEYIDAYYEVLLYGSDGVSAPTLRTADQTEAGIYWGYDGRPGLGTPPRLYNQIAAHIIEQEGATLDGAARLFALMNVAMADAAIQAWMVKYRDDFWRPIIAIRAGANDTNDFTVGVPDWIPLGAPGTNPAGQSGINFTPPFPAYTSGHAIMGAAGMNTIANFYGRDDIAFDFVSDEFNGINRDANGSVRPLRTRHFDSISEAIEENGQSRIYLGIHWSFDKEQGIDAGMRISDFAFANAMLPR